jgi:hypothetical protein
MDTAPSFRHLAALSDHNGIFEHALFDAPRRDHGYCVDDVARALIVVVREPRPTPALKRLADIYLRFLEAAIDESGLSHNRMAADGTWSDAATMGDWWGRSIWALGVTVNSGVNASMRKRALGAFHLATRQRAWQLRTMTFAALGAAEVAAAHPHDGSARRLLLDIAIAVPTTRDAGWPWPESRLGYGNASIPEALIASGNALGDPATTQHGLELLAFLLAIETTDGRLSVTGSDGRRRGQASPLFDQQPIEVAAIADACARAHDVTGDASWLVHIALAWNWFRGDNDSGIPMFDIETGAGFDGLEEHGRNENRGAESTLAALSTYQQARRLRQLSPSERTPSQLSPA